MSNEELKDWPGYEEHFTSGFVRHKGYTHMARKARMQMGEETVHSGLIKLWVMSREFDHREEIDAVMVGLFNFTRMSNALGLWLNLPTGHKAYHSAPLMLPLQRRQRSNTAMLKRCQDSIQELMVWHKMENM